MDRNNCEFKFSGEPRGSVCSRVSVRRTGLVASTRRRFDNFSMSRRFRGRASLQSSLACITVSNCIPPKTTRLQPCCRNSSRKLHARKRIFSTGSALTETKFFAVKRTRTATDYLRISTTSARCWRRYSPWPISPMSKCMGRAEELEKLKAPLAHLKSSVVYTRNDAVALTSVF
jgi:hypothetical protein